MTSAKSERVQMEPGVYWDMPFHVYINIDAISSTGLKAVYNSPRYYKKRPPFDPVASLIGRAGHTSCLEPMQFLREYALYTKRRAGKEYEAFKEANAGKSILNDREYQLAIDMQEAVADHPVASSILYPPGRKTEVSIVWIDERTGSKLKARLDLHHTDHDADLKTTASLQWFHRDIDRYHYDLQAAMYSEAAMQIRGHSAPFYFVAVEKSLPHDVRVVRMTENDLAIGTRKFHEALDTLNRCRATNEWPGRYPEIEDANLRDPETELQPISFGGLELSL